MAIENLILFIWLLLLWLNVCIFQNLSFSILSVSVPNFIRRVAHENGHSLKEWERWAREIQWSKTMGVARLHSWWRLFGWEAKRNSSPIEQIHLIFLIVDYKLDFNLASNFYTVIITVSEIPKCHHKKILITWKVQNIWNRLRFYFFRHTSPKQYVFCFPGLR